MAAVKRDTGFPEPFSPDRNTTLPHPEADTSPNATIEGPDIALERGNSRRSFGRHAKMKNSGKIPLAERDMPYDNIQYSDGSSVKNLTDNEPLSPTSTTGGMTTSSESEDMQRGSGDSGVFINKDERDEQGYREGERKKGVLRKLGLHKV